MLHRIVRRAADTMGIILLAVVLVVSWIRS